ncbi:WavE lipopolysaccharide synthesis family protein [Shewanella sp. NIFS-20-20]|nr:WavE lipopolysaccharide synthesis family protein [Shewanella sp. NIFS-20-20]
MWSILLATDIDDSVCESTTKYSPLHAEQSLCQLWLNQLDNHSSTLMHRHAGTKEHKQYWQKFVASNLVVLEQLGLGLIGKYCTRHTGNQAYKLQNFSYFVISVGSAQSIIRYQGLNIGLLPLT